MSNETIPPNLFKANLELQLRLQRLMQENGQQWLENAARGQRRHCRVRRGNRKPA